MPKPGEHKTVQARILGYAKEIGWALYEKLWKSLMQVHRSDFECIEEKGFLINDLCLSKKLIRCLNYIRRTQGSLCLHVIIGWQNGHLRKHKLPDFIIRCFYYKNHQAYHFITVEYNLIP